MEEADAGASGFRMLLGPEGLNARLVLLRNARQSLDLQYYHLHDDASGRLILRELRDAARRGVRVRLLLDDLYTGEIEGLLQGLDAYPHAEVRLFNPFPTRGSLVQRFAAALGEFPRLHRRMHNKLFIADGAFAVAGGRNIGDEYFMRSERSNFFDYDVLIAGPVVPQAASIFDEYWNSLQVRTLSSVRPPDEGPGVLRKSLDRLVDGETTPVLPPVAGPDRLGRSPASDELLRGRVQLVFGPARAFADSPSKAWGHSEFAQLPSGAVLDGSRRLLREEFLGAQRRIAIVSPYLIPGLDALASGRANVQRGVRISLLTNSLASTDEPVVHTGYRRYRDNMLRAGIEIHELHPRLGEALLLPGEVRNTPLRLHSKATIIDGERIVIGSANFDPRSDDLNTEFGIVVHSPALAAQAETLMELLERKGAYKVRLKEGSARELEWVIQSDDGGDAQVIDSEPGADAWTRFKLYLQSLFIPESLL